MANPIPILKQEKFIKRLKNRLGEPKVNVELDLVQFEEAIHSALNKYSEFFPKVVSEEITMIDDQSVYELSCTLEEVGTNLLFDSVNNWADEGTPTENQKITATGEGYDDNSYRRFSVDSTSEGIKITDITTVRGEKYFFSAQVMPDSTSPLDLTVSIRNENLSGDYDEEFTTLYRNTWNEISFYYDENYGGRGATSIIIHSDGWDYGTWRIDNARFRIVKAGPIYGVADFIPERNFLSLGLDFGQDVAWQLFGGFYGEQSKLASLSRFAQDYVTRLGTLEMSKNVFRSKKTCILYEYPNKVLITPQPTREESAFVFVNVKRGLEDLRWEDEDWVFKYALALCKMMLAEVRGKYGDLPTAMGTVTLNAETLRSEGKEEITTLEEQLGRMGKGTVIDGYDPF